MIIIYGLDNSMVNTNNTILNVKNKKADCNLRKDKPGTLEYISSEKELWIMNPDKLDKVLLAYIDEKGQLKFDYDMEVTNVKVDGKKLQNIFKQIYIDIDKTKKEINNRIDNEVSTLNNKINNSLKENINNMNNNLTQTINNIKNELNNNINSQISNYPTISDIENMIKQYLSNSHNIQDIMKLFVIESNSEPQNPKEGTFWIKP